MELTIKQTAERLANSLNTLVAVNCENSYAEKNLIRACAKVEIVRDYLTKWNWQLGEKTLEVETLNVVDMFTALIDAIKPECGTAADGFYSYTVQCAMEEYNRVFF